MILKVILFILLKYLHLNYLMIIFFYYFEFFWSGHFKWFIITFVCWDKKKIKTKIVCTFKFFYIFKKFYFILISVIFVYTRVGKKRYGWKGKIVLFCKMLVCIFPFFFVEMHSSVYEEAKRSVSFRTACFFMRWFFALGASSSLSSSK